MPPLAPTTPLLSLFAGPPESPLSEGGKWAQGWFSRAPLQKGSNYVTDSLHGDPNYSFWTPQAFPDNVEVWGCTDGGQLGAAVETWRLNLWQGDPRRGVGYTLMYGGAIAKYFALRRYDSTAALDFTEVDFAGGYPTTMLLRINGDNVEALASYDSGATWSLMGYITDTNHRGGDWHIGLGIEDPTGGGLSFSCFGGGVPRRTQFFRWTRGFKEPAAD